MSFQINSTDPPAGGHPRGKFDWKQPTTTGATGNGQACGAVGRPSVTMHWSRMNRTAWDWYNSFFPDATTPSVALTSATVFNPHKSGGAGWETFSTKAILWRPRCGGNTSGGALVDVEITISDLM